ncbi:monofunctional biosynthetic peptidoglycan transglycosylase [Hyphomonas sp.]|uniref:monofunctional biosynthetic peptidoglycan transglycosylase n=1 Tax=Hyphomonas sp. TaxID=87 RepID=UPI00391B7C40
MTGTGIDSEDKPRPRWRRPVIITGLVLLVLGLLPHFYALILAAMPVPGTILMAQRAGQGQEVRQHWTRLEDISPRLVYAVIAAEDANFCTHGGIDWDAVDAAREWNERNPDRPRRGGSTISQQTAKNVFFWNGGGMVRKAGEAWMTYVIEAIWGKRRIMEVYLNVAEWGDGLFGAEAAAQARFGKSAVDLTEREAALLAAVLPSPNRWRAVNPGPYVQRRAGTIQARMRVVAGQGYAACVFGEEAPRLPREAPKGEAPPPPPVMPDLPDAPETGEEAIGLPPLPEEAEPAPAGEDPTPQADEEFRDFLDSAEESLRAPPPAEVEPLPPIESEPEDASPALEEGPRDLRPDP